MLKENKIDFEYREYTERPLSLSEIKKVLKALDQKAHALLRSRDAKKFDIDPDIDELSLVQKMHEHPTLLQRPILIKREGGKIVGAEVGRPVENLHALF